MIDLVNINDILRYTCIYIPVVTLLWWILI